MSPLIYLNSPRKMTVAIGVWYFQHEPRSSEGPKEHLLMAASLMMAIPEIVLFFTMQRYFVRGVVMSGIKG